MSRFVALILAGLTLGCGSGDGEPPPPVQQVTARTGEAARVVTPSGSTITIEVASNDTARARGLMFRETLADDRGMLFLFRTDDSHSFWMKNTLIPLDMIWLDAGGRIVHIERDVPPCPGDPCPSYGPDIPSRHVLELSAGGAARYDLKPGDVLRIEAIDSYTIE